ncbi:TolC family protein [Calidithermus timidus]|uniref:TolC family protein n=1 Tax=Calidithermus timidus TaxID=307124 RepID=UPI00036E11F0|nr:TolC family protein [Calidithermus timidus]
MRTPSAVHRSYLVEKRGVKSLQRRGLFILAFGVQFLAHSLAQSFYAPLQNHPLLVQARLGLEAAQAQLRAQASSVSLQAQGGNAWLNFQDPIPATQVASASVGVVFTPFPFGDTADAITQARLGVEQAALGLRQAQANLEAQALEAAYRVRLAQLGLEAAQSGARLAQASLEAVRLRAQREAASPAEVRQAEAQLRQAQLQAEDAGRNLELARRNLSDLLGASALEMLFSPHSGETIPPIPSPPLPATPPSVRQAELQLVQAQLNYARAERGIWPVAQASYTYNTSPRDSFSLSLNSRTLQPQLGYSYQNPPTTSTGQPRPESQFQLGVSLNLSPAIFEALEAGRKQVEAAQAALEAAKRSAALQEASLQAALQSAEAQVSLAQAAQQDAERSLAESRERERLGLSSPLATLQAELGLAQAQLALEQAKLNRLSRILDLYRFYAQPLSEVK